MNAPANIVQVPRFGTIEKAIATLKPGEPLYCIFPEKFGAAAKRFLDGFPGLYIAWANAFSVLVRQSRLYEAEHRADLPCPTNLDHSAGLPKS